MSDHDLESSFFPAPPAYYRRYTSAHLAAVDDHLLVPASSDAPADSFPRTHLRPPSAALVLQRGFYHVYGQTWPIRDSLPSLSDMAVTELFDPSAGACAASRPR